MSNVRATSWSVTINNPSEKDEEEIALARQKGWSVEGQKEVGESGTPHLQLFVKTPQVRFSAVKKAFSRAHIEIARNPAALENYVHKEDTRVAQLQVSQDQYPSLSKLWKLMFDWLLGAKGVDMKIVDDKFVCSGDYLYPVYDEVRRRREPLSVFDDFIKAMIVSGYHVETMGINPQVRGCWNSYWHALLHREFLSRSNENVDADKKTDRQTDTESIVASEENLSTL